MRICLALQEEELFGGCLASVWQRSCLEVAAQSCGSGRQEGELQHWHCRGRGPLSLCCPLYSEADHLKRTEHSLLQSCPAAHGNEKYAFWRNAAQTGASNNHNQE